MHPLGQHVQDKCLTNRRTTVAQHRFFGAMLAVASSLTGLITPLQAMDFPPAWQPVWHVQHIVTAQEANFQHAASSVAIGHFNFAASSSTASASSARSWHSTLAGFSSILTGSNSRSHYNSAAGSAP